jgi:hypothetical protein
MFGLVEIEYQTLWQLYYTLPVVDWYICRTFPKRTTKFISTTFCDYFGTIWPSTTKYVLRDCGGKETAFASFPIILEQLGFCSPPFVLPHLGHSYICLRPSLPFLSPEPKAPRRGFEYSLSSQLSHRRRVQRRHLQLEEEEALAMGSEGSAPVVGESLALSCPPSILTNCLL